MTDIAWLDDGDGPVVVLLHAFPCDNTMWRAQVRPLIDAGWRVMIPDLPGFGNSGLLPDEPSLTSVVDVLANSLLARSIDRCVLVGLSVGGYLAMEWLRRHPEMLAAVVMCDTKAGVDTQQAQAGRIALAAAVEGEPATCGLLLRERLLPVLVGATTASSRPEVIETVVEWLDAVAPETVAWYQRAMARRQDSFDTLRWCEIPALVIWGDEDVMSPVEEQEAMVDALRDARLAVIPQAGHLSAIENPEAVTRSLVEFLTAVRRVNLEG